MGTEQGLSGSGVELNNGVGMTPRSNTMSGMLMEDWGKVKGLMGKGASKRGIEG